MRRVSLIVLLLASQVASAREVVLGADTAGRGGGAVAVGRDNTTIMLNPGAAALYERYDFGANLGVGPDGGLRWSIGALDGMTAKPLAFGLMYAGDRWQPPFTDATLPGWQRPGETVVNRHRAETIALAIGMPTADRRFAAGVNGSLSFLSTGLAGRELRGNAGVGLATLLTKGLTFGLAGRNLLPITSLEDQPAMIVGGLALADEEVGLATVDVTGRIGPAGRLPIDLNVGGELRASAVSFRGGYMLGGEALTHRGTIGVGFEDQGAALDLALQVPLSQDLGLGSLTFFVGVRFRGPTGIDERGEPARR